MRAKLAAIVAAAIIIVVAFLVLILTPTSPSLRQASVDFEDGSWGGAYVERVGGMWRLVVPLRGQDACAVLRSRQEFLGGFFEVEMKTVSGNTGCSAFFLYGEYGGGDFDEIDVEVYGFMEDPGNIYANLNPATADFTCWAGGKRHLVRTRLGFMANEGFHRYGIKWVPGEVVEFYVDGVKVGVFYGERVPKRPMRLFMQTMYAGWMAEFGEPQGEAVTLFRNLKAYA